MSSKQPLTPYILFLKEERPKVVREMPDASVTEIVSEVARRWRETPDQAKARFVKQSQKERKKYESETPLYKVQICKRGECKARVIQNAKVQSTGVDAKVRQKVSVNAVTKV